MKACDRVETLLFESFERELQIEEQLAVDAHVRNCSDCARTARAVRLAQTGLELERRDTDRGVDVERNLARIRSRIDRRKPVASRFRPLVWLAVAAGVGGVWFGVRHLVAAPVPSRGEPVTQVEPAAGPDRHEHTVPKEPQRAPVVAAEPVQHVLSPLEPIDSSRLAAAREKVRQAIVDGLPVLELGNVDGFVDQVDQDTRELARAGWPVARLVERLLEDDTTAAAALRWMGRRGDAISQRSLEESLLDPRRREAAAAALSDALGRQEPAALVAVLERAVRARPRALDASYAFDFARRTNLSAALPWIDAWTRERAARNDATGVDQGLAALASFEDVAALRLLLRMGTNERLEEKARVTAEALLARSVQPALDLARDRSSARRATDLIALSDALLGIPALAYVPTWIELAGAKELARGDRRTAILLAGEHGGPEHLEALQRLLPRFDRNERDLKAATLIAIYTIGDVPALERTLATTSKDARERILEEFERLGTTRQPMSILLELARRLEPAVSTLQP